MKRFLKHLVLGTAAVCALAVPTLAADFTHCADYLNDMGLFQGGANGYDLDRAPTRLEASVMLVRLLGAEEEAKANQTYTAPFNDVADWAKPYVQYLYDNGLGNGVGSGKFGSDSLCTAQQYTTFLLRALGYSDAAGGDFTYATAMDFAQKLGLVDVLNCDEDNFLRDNLAAMSFTALATKPKSGEADLLTKLVQDGAIAKDDAEMYLGFFSDYRDYSAAITKANLDASKLSTDVGVVLGMSLADMDFLTASIDMDMAVESDLEHMDQTKLAYDMNMTMEIDPAVAAAMGVPEDQASMTLDMECWYADGYYYIKSGENKMKVALSFEDAMGQMPTSDLTATTSQVEPLCAIESLTKATNSDGTVSYTINYATSSFNSLIDSVLSSLPTDTAEAASMAFNALDVEVFFNGDTLTSMEVLMDMSTEVEGQSMCISMVMVMDNIKTGDDVKVTLPSDLNTYTEITAEDMGLVTQ